jgi:superfamily II DNA or RNA helicase
MNMQLRPYQEEALQAWKRAGERGVVVLPTGAGKTFIGLAAMREELERGGSVAVLVPTIVLAEQWRQRIWETLHVRAALYCTTEKALGRVTIFVVNSAYLHRELLRPFTLVIIDEAHHLGAPKWGEIVNQLNGKRVLGLTATPENAPLPVVYKMLIAHARAHGAVADLEVVPYFVGLTHEEWVAYSEIERKVKETARALRIAEARGSAREVAELERVMKILTGKRRQLMSEVVSKRYAVLEIAMKHRGERILVFCESVRGAEAIKSVLTKAGVRAETYHSKMPKHLRSMVLAGWGRSFEVLVAVRSLDEGVDVPEVRVGIIVATGKSIRQLTQRMGRLIRPKPGKKAVLYVVIARGTYETSILARIRRIAYGGYN